MENALKFFMGEIALATREGYVVHSVEAEELDSRELQIVALSPDDSVLAVSILPPQEATLAEIEEAATMLAAVVVACEEALSGGAYEG